METDGDLRETGPWCELRSRTTCVNLVPRAFSLVRPQAREKALVTGLDVCEREDRLFAVNDFNKLTIPIL